VVKVSTTALTAGGVTISTGAGNDAIELTVANTLGAGAAVALNGGAGKDTLKITDLDAADAQYVTINVNAGESTISAYDSVTGFNLGGAERSVLLDFTGTATVAANQAAASVAGYTAAELTYSITN